MAEIHVEHRKRGQSPPFALIFHLEMNSLLEPVEGSGEVDGSLEFLITFPKCKHTPFDLDWFLLGPFRNTNRLRSGVEVGVGEGRPAKLFYLSSTITGLCACSGGRKDLLTQEDGEFRAFVNGICNSLPWK